MRKRERENPCGICGHYHKYEEGEVCGVCGHRLKPSDGEGAPSSHESAFPTEVLKEFLFLGSYDNASRSEVLRTLSISHILNVRVQALFYR
jgi:dual specificity MAP kinase phosphatase